jgi:hypothetical protein
MFNRQSDFRRTDMIELDTRSRAQLAFDEWAGALPIDGQSGLPIVTEEDIDRLLSRVNESQILGFVLNRASDAAYS